MSEQEIIDLIERAAAGDAAAEAALLEASARALAGIIEG